MAQLKIYERQDGNLTIFDLSGDILFGEGNITLRNAIRKALGEGKKHLLLNFRNVGYVDSGGIGELVSGLIAINRESGKIRLSNLTPRIEELLTICKLIEIFDVCETESEAIAGYR